MSNSIFLTYEFKNYYRRSNGWMITKKHPRKTKRNNATLFLLTITLCYLIVYTF